jgi:hypothetical protein
VVANIHATDRGGNSNFNVPPYGNSNTAKNFAQFSSLQNNPFPAQSNQQFPQQVQRENQRTAPGFDLPLAERSHASQSRSNDSFLDQVNRHFSRQMQGEDQRTAPGFNLPLAERSHASQSRSNDSFEADQRDIRDFNQSLEQNSQQQSNLVPLNYHSITYEFNNSEINGCFNIRIISQSASDLNLPHSEYAFHGCIVNNSFNIHVNGNIVAANVKEEEEEEEEEGESIMPEAGGEDEMEYDEGE